MSANVLYITYDGLLEPLGQSQVLRYLEKLSDSHNIYLISFEKAQDWQNIAERQRVQEKVHSHQIHWIPLRYHKSPSALATTYDLLQGITVGLFIAITREIKIVHARRYVPSVIALVLKKLLGTKFIFDMRGFWADERVGCGIWPRNSYLYHLAKWFDKQLLLNSDHTVSLREAAIDAIRKFNYMQNQNISISCIRTCTDLELFNAKEGNQKNKESSLIVSYIGSATGWCLFDEVVKFFEIINTINPNSYLYILNKGEHDFIRQKLALSKISNRNLIIEESSPQEISKKMSIIDLSVFFIKPGFYTTASCPTKVGELLATGIPCVTNDGIGDMTQIIEQEKVGVILRNFDEPAMHKAAREILELLQDKHLIQRCRAAAIKYFSLEDGVKAYRNIYQQLGGE